MKMQIDKRFEPLCTYADGSEKVCVQDSGGYTVTADCPSDPRTAERVVKTLLWAKGGNKVFCTHGKTARLLKEQYRSGGARAFDCDFMQKIYREDFRVVHTADLPYCVKPCKKIGGFSLGRRAGLDLGGSEIKIVAKNDGGTVLEKRIEWQPKQNADPDYHYGKLCEAADTACRALGGLDAIGISSAGVIIDNEARVSSLFTAVADRDYFRASKLFVRLQQKYQGAAITVANDGDVAALAGAEAMGESDLLGLSFGTSLAGGAIYGGSVNGWLNELAFVPVAVNKDAAIDEWSGDAGCGVNYLCQDAVLRLSAQAGFAYPDGLTLSQKMHLFADKGGAMKDDVFGDIGRYLACALPLWQKIYGISTVLITGGVVAAGGATIKRSADETLRENGQKIKILLPDDRLANVGQAAAAASLPQLTKI